MNNVVWCICVKGRSPHYFNMKIGIVTSGMFGFVFVLFLFWYDIQMVHRNRCNFMGIYGNKKSNFLIPSTGTGSPSLMIGWWPDSTLWPSDTTAWWTSLNFNHFNHLWLWCWSCVKYNKKNIVTYGIFQLINHRMSK